MCAANLVNPFLGLVPFGERDILFARDRDVELIQSRIWAARVTVLFAGSGVGKSSFLNAKLMGELKKCFGADYVASPGAQHWAREDPCQEFAETSERLRDLPATRNGGIIVLDQFEEVFQYFPSPAALRGFGEGLAKAVDERSSPDIRLLISIREEFLAQLTALDDFIPGVLTNYYRLRKFTKKQARFVIENTARQQGIETSDRIAGLLTDLANVEQGNRSASGVFVDPPYLQIVCHRMWVRENPQPGQAFLATYEEGAARHELEAYCREKLNTCLCRQQRFLVRRALEHLTGPHEAKKFVRVNDLARELGHRDTAQLTGALRPLAAKDVRILREWTEHRRAESEPNASGGTREAAAPTGGEQRHVYQLYHDMYAPMLWRWKEEQAAAERQQTILKSAVAATLAAVVLLFGVLAPGLRWWFVGRPDIARPTYGSNDQMAGILEMRSAFARTLLLRPIGDLFLRQYADKLSAAAAMRKENDEAIAYRLMALAASGTSDAAAATRALGPAADLLATEDVVGVADAVVVPDANGGVLKMVTLDGRILTKRLDAREPAKTLAALPSILALSTSGRYAIRVLGSGRELRFSRIDLDEAGPASVSASPPPEGPPQAVGLLSASFSDDERKAVVIADGRVLVLEGPEQGPWSQWEAPPLANAEVTRAAIAGQWLAVSWRDVGGNVQREKVARWNLSHRTEPRFPPEMPADCFLPPAVRVILKPDGSVLARCGQTERWSWVPTDGHQPSHLFSDAAEIEQSTAASSEANSAPPPGVRTIFPQAFDDAAKILVSLDFEGRLLFSSLDPGNPRHYVLPISERRRFQSGYRRLSASPSKFASNGGALVTIDQSTVRVWKTSHLADRLAKRGFLRVDLDRPDGDACTLRESSIIHSNGRWLLSAPANAASCPKSVSQDGRRILVYMSDRIEYGARGSDRLVSLPAVSGAAFGPGADKLSVITVGPQPALVILGRSANGTLEAQWSLPCYNCRLVRSQNEDATLAYSDFWLFRISAGNRFSSADAPWPEIEAVFWHKRLTSVAPEELSDMRKLRVNGSEVIEFGENALRQGGYSVGWQSILTPPWKTTRTLNYECGTAGSESPTRPIEALCDWEHRSKGSHPTGTEAVFAGLSAEPAPVTQASMTPFVATGRRGDRR